VWGNTALCFQEILRLDVSLSSLIFFSTGLDFNFFHNPYVRRIIIGQSKECIHPCLGITNFLWEPGTLIRIPSLFFSRPLGLGLKKFTAFFLSYFFRHAIRIPSLSAPHFPFSKLCFKSPLNNETDFVLCILAEKIWKRAWPIINAIHEIAKCVTYILGLLGPLWKIGCKNTM